MFLFMLKLKAHNLVCNTASCRTASCRSHGPSRSFCLSAVSPHYSHTKTLALRAENLTGNIISHSSTSPFAQREVSIDRQGTRCAAPCCQELVMLAKEVAGEWSWRYRQASGFTLRRPQHKSCTCSEAAARSSEHSFT